MKPSTSLAFCALLALSLAVPLERRQDITITSTIDVIETVDVVVTVWLPPGAQPSDQDHPPQVAHPNKPNLAAAVHITPVQAAVVPVSTRPSVTQQSPQEATPDQANKSQEQVNEEQDAKNKAAQEQSIEAQGQINAAQEKANEAQETANNDKVAQNAAAQNQPAPASQPSPPAAPVNTPVAAPVKLAAPPATEDSTSSEKTVSTSGGSCGEIGGTCSATNVTYYGGGLGACGWSNDTASEDFFALAHEMMGLQSNGNPYCGRKAAISHQGKTIYGTLTDKCMGCGLQSIDLSEHLFKQMFVEDVGNYHDIEWHFTS